MSSAVLRLAGSGQSYASSPFEVKATEGVPTRSALLGLIGAALGVARGDSPDWFEDLDVWVRVDNPGTVVVDFQTINAPSADVAEIRARQKNLGLLLEGTRRAANFTVPQGDGSRWAPKGATTMLARKAYLAGAEFIVAVTHPDESRVAEVSAALRRPAFLTYLGRRAFAPAFPSWLGIHAGAPEGILGALPTGTPDRPLAVHRIVGDRNYASAHVTPEAPATLEDLWKGWKP